PICIPLSLICEAHCTDVPGTPASRTTGTGLIKSSCDALVAFLRFEHFQLAQRAEDRQAAELEIDPRDDAVVEQLDALLEVRRAVRQVLHEEGEVDVARGDPLEG